MVGDWRLQLMLNRHRGALKGALARDRSAAVLECTMWYCLSRPVPTIQSHLCLTMGVVSKSRDKTMEQGIRQASSWRVTSWVHSSRHWASGEEYGKSACLIPALAKSSRTMTRSTHCSGSRERL